MTQCSTVNKHLEIVDKLCIDCRQGKPQGWDESCSEEKEGKEQKGQKLKQKTSQDPVSSKTCSE